MKTVTVYKGDKFEVHEQWSFGRFEKAWENGAITRREMPNPSPKRPLKTKMVYFWVGENALDLQNRKSAQMPPSVTEGSVVYDRSDCHAYVDAWHGHITPAFRGLRNLQVGIRLLVTPAAASA